MPLKLPTLRGTLIQRASICASIAPNDPSFCSWVEAFGDDRIAQFDGDEQWLVAFADRFPDGELHVHVNVSRKSSYFVRRAKEHSDPVGLMDFLMPMASVEAFLTLHGEFLVPLSKIPDGGFIQTMTGGLATTVGHRTLTITGGEADISGDPDDPFDHIGWNADAEEVTGTLVASLAIDLDEGYLQTAVNLLQSGVEQFVLERGDARK